MNPQSTGTVSITSPNVIDPPAIDPNLLGHAYDKRVLTEGVKEMVRFMENAKAETFIKQIFRAPKSSADADIDVRGKVQKVQ